MVFLMHARKGNKYYCKFADSQVVIFIHIDEKKMIFHTCKPISDFFN
jgi:hypothetical protein